jgi:hypothetical protein
MRYVRKFVNSEKHILEDQNFLYPTYLTETNSRTSQCHIQGASKIPDFHRPFEVKDIQHI